MKALVVAAVIAFAAADQSGFRGLQPGQSTRADVERALGAPVVPAAGSIAEYPSGREGEKVFVTFASSGSVERIVLVYAANTDRANAVRAAGLPSAQATGSAVNDRDRLEEYFAGPNVVFTYAGNTAASGVNRIAFLDKAFFDLAAAKAKPSADPTPTRGTDPPAPPIVTQPGIVATPEPMKRTVIGVEAGVTRGDVAAVAGAGAPPPPARTAGTDKFTIDDTLGRTLAGTYEVDDAPWLPEIVVTWEGNRLHARMPGWTAALYAEHHGKFTVTGDPETDMWSFTAGGDARVLFQFRVSANKSLPPQVDFVDDRGGKMIVETGVKKTRSRDRD